jgi:hypothetical protein
MRGIQFKIRTNGKLYSNKTPEIIQSCVYIFKGILYFTPTFDLSDIQTIDLVTLAK